MRLSLKRESLVALSTDEMAGIAGGSHTCAVTHSPSCEDPCYTPTLPVNACIDCIRSKSCQIQTQ